MNETLKQHTAQQKHPGLSQSVIDTINAEHVNPSPRWTFLVRGYGVWGLWIVSVLLGSVALSVALFVFTHAGFVFYEATHDSVLEFVFETLPYLWIAVFVLMGVWSHCMLRRTKRGYRHSLWLILGSSLFFSFAGGILMHSAGMGYLVDTHMSRSIPLYHALEERELKIWQSPEHGRLIGTYQKVTADKTAAVFIDTQGKTWTLDTAELNPFDMARLRTHEPVRVFGVLSSTSPAYLHGCGILPFAFTQPVSFRELQEQRVMFLERMRYHAKPTSGSVAVAAGSASGVCANHAAVARVHRNFGK